MRRNRANYQTLLNMNGGRSSMCASDAPVCPPMWNAPIPPIPNYTAPIPPILPTFHRVPRPLGEVEAVPQTGASFGSRPLGPTPGSSSGGTGGKIDDPTYSYCRQCQQIEGCVGVKNPDGGPWPMRNAATNLYEHPFMDKANAAVFNQAATGRTNSTYTDVPHTIFTDLALAQLNGVAGLNATSIVLKADMEGTFQAGHVYLKNGTNAKTFNVTSFTTDSNGLVTLTGAYVGGFREGPFPANTMVMQFQNQITSTSRLSLDVVVANKAINVSTGVSLTNDLLRGEGIPDNAAVRILNSDLSATGVQGLGASIIGLRTTTWPDRDITTCVIAAADTEKYCCANGDVTPENYAAGAGRCAPLARYGTCGPTCSNPQVCPAGYKFVGGDPYGLVCQKCEQGTSSYDPTIVPANCPANGIGCRKCCEEDDILCL